MARPLLAGLAVGERVRSGLRYYSVAIAVLLGVPLGLGLFTFHFGEGFSYFSSDPKACVNCHIMNPQYDSWQKASHHTAAKCVDCHLPHDLIPKLIAKTDNGYRHSKGFTLQDFPEPIQITPRNSDILQENCLRCHSDFVHNVVAGSKNPSRENINCVHCHWDVGHGAQR